MFIVTDPMVVTSNILLCVVYVFFDVLRSKNCGPEIAHTHCAIQGVFCWRRSQISAVVSIISL